ncbi:MAG: dependent oxidoreductase [Marmoricola sp.]|nr:dependent oxidoreductase [Marmoricola sp.]
MEETCDVVIVGSRLAGAAAAVPFARAGRRVVVLDRSRFPSNQLSTHLLFPSGVHEIQKIGALDAILANDPVKSPWVSIQIGDDLELSERWRPSGDIDYCLCVNRLIQDMELVNAARRAGAEVREKSRVVKMLWRGGRAAGVRYADAEGNEHNLYAKLVVGADGRRSTIAQEVGSFRPYRASRNGRGLIFRYGKDPLVNTRAGETIFQWWEGDSLSFMFPSVPRGTALILFMGASEEVERAKVDPEGYWAEKLKRHPRMAKRLEGVTDMTPLMSTNTTSSFFRASSGPGWALAGDAGHFKDPVIGQGQRDAMWSGRVLAETVAGVLDDPAELDQALRRWEQKRDKECLASYHFGNLETRVEAVPPVLAEIVRLNSKGVKPDLSDLYGRARSMPQVLSLPRLTVGLTSALVHNDSDQSNRELIAAAVRDLKVHLGVRRELRRQRFRNPIPLTGSEHGNAEPPAYRAPAPVRPAPAAESATPVQAETNAQKPSAPEAQKTPEKHEVNV